MLIQPLAAPHNPNLLFIEFQANNSQPSSLSSVDKGVGRWTLRGTDIPSANFYHACFYVCDTDM